MKITSDTPKDWRNLQNLVCKYLNEAGYKAETPKTIELVRGKVEVDVYATADNELIKMFVCECKNWSNPVPKEKVHAFRTVVADSGATVGILISKSGFQQGAIDAAYCSNVLLKDWDGFIGMISNQWIYHRLIKLKHLLQPLSVYIDPLDVEIDSYEETVREKYFDIQKKCFQEFMLGSNINTKFLQEESISIGEKSFSYINELLDYLEEVYIVSVDKFASLIPKVEDYKFKTGGYTLLSMMEDFY